MHLEKWMELMILSVLLLGILSNAFASGIDVMDSSVILNIKTSDSSYLSNSIDTNQDTLVSSVLAGDGAMSKKSLANDKNKSNIIREEFSPISNLGFKSGGRAGWGKNKFPDEFFVDTIAPTKRVIVKFISNPISASLMIDSIYYQTPYNKALSVGPHIVEMIKDGYITKRDTIMATINGQQISWKLSQVQTRLIVDAIDAVTGEDLIADVYVDSIKYGQTPFDNQVPAGHHQISVSTDSMQGWIAADLKQSSLNHSTIRCTHKLVSEAGSRSPESILRVIRSHIGGFRYIYERYLKQNPNLGGKISLKFTIAPSGNIITIFVASSNTGNDELDEEIKNKASNMKFDSIEKGNVTVTYAFVLDKN